MDWAGLCPLCLRCHWPRIPRGPAHRSAALYKWRGGTRARCPPAASPFCSSPSQPLAMKVAAVASSPLPAGAGGPLKAVRPGEAARCGPGPGVSPVAAEQAAAALLYDMKGCYSRLRALVPTLPRHRRVSKVELLQHVIDYIWDLQLELQCGPPRPAAAGDSPEAPCIPAADRILCR
ncbi:LOW QUALITY PROTEIN: DNA-binding protein inhibitor ID-1 [Sylvia atricapilla]